MKAFRILLPNTLLPAAERMCSILRSELSVVDPTPIWRKQSRRLVQIDLPDFHGRIFEEVARRRCMAVEVLLRAWIEQYNREVLEAGEGEPAVLPHTDIDVKLRMINEWADLGYSGREDAVQDLINKLARE